jgi:hypothetical protein
MVERTQTRSRILSIRIDEELLDALRERAREDGRSVSGEIVYFVKEQVEARPRLERKPQPISGWLAHVSVPRDHQEFRGARVAAGSLLTQAAKRRARRR